MKHYIYIAIIIAILIGGYTMWPKPQQTDPLIELLNQQHKTDSLRIISLLDSVSHAQGIIAQNNKEIAVLKREKAKISDKYSKEREKLSKLSSGEMIEVFVDETGGRVDSIYSIPRMNLINALDIFLCAEQEHETNGILEQIITKQDTTIYLQRKQVTELLEANDIALKSIELHRKTIQLQADKLIKLEKKHKRSETAKKILGATTIVATVIAIL